MVMDIRIVDVEWALDDTGATYQAYVVEIARGLKTWAVRRRYSAFDKLRRVVTKELGPMSRPFPAKNIFGGGNPAERQQKLELWLRELAEAVAPAPAAYAAFAEFVKEPADPAPIGGAPPQKPARRSIIQPQPAPPPEPPQPPSPPKWDPSFMSSDPLAGLADALTVAPRPAPAPPKPRPPPKPKPAKPEGEAAPRFPPPAAVRPTFLLGSATSYAATGEGLRDAIKAGDLAGVKDLVARDASLASYQDRQTESMLHLACLFDHVAIAIELAAHGADPTVTNAAGESPLDVAQPSLRKRLAAAREQWKQSS